LEIAKKDRTPTGGCAIQLVKAHPGSELAKEGT
jgi:hypothetical protein